MMMTSLLVDDECLALPWGECQRRAYVQAGAQRQACSPTKFAPLG
jgi:hypothetical protein